MKHILRNLARSFGLTVKDEIEEIRELKITEEDEKEAEILESAVSIAAASVGIYYPSAIRPIIRHALAIALRDGKDGLETPNKLIIKRLIDNYKTLKQKDVE